MILIGIGSNLPWRGYATPRAVAEAAIAALAEAGVRVLRRSRWYASRPVPDGGEPFFVNGVVAVATECEPGPLLALLHDIEARFGRVRPQAGLSRTLDLDLLDYDGRRMVGPEGPRLPHPRLEARAFVLRPLADVAPDWRHPVSGASLEALLAALAPEADAWPEDRKEPR